MSPTARSMAELRKRGFSACVVEKWVPASPKGFRGPIITRDAFNFGDILACKIGEPGALLVQTTSTANVSARLAKIRSIPEAGIWMAAGNRILIMGWAKRGAKGETKHWTCREIEVLTSGERELK